MIVSAGVPNSNQLLGFFPARNPQVDPHVVNLGHLLPLAGVHLMDGPLTGNSGYHSIAGFYAHPPAANYGAIVSANGVKKQVALIIDIFDNEPQFVEVTSQEHTGVTLRIQGGNTVSQHILFVGIGFGGDKFIKNHLSFTLLSRWGPAGQQFAQKFRNLVFVFDHEA